MTPPLVVGNWKMHGGPSACVELAKAIAEKMQTPVSTQVAIAPPFIALLQVQQAIQNRPVQLAAQNCHFQDSGAFTGEVSPAMLAEVGCEFVIIGHSERRQLFCENDELISQKIPAVLKHRMRPILCVGETIAQRNNKETSSVITRQLDAALKGVSQDDIETIDIAYEPVWAIGSGLNASADQICETHTQIKEFVTRRFGATAGNQVRILYGGSVKPDNIQMIAELALVNGVLVGGASLVVDSFMSIVKAFSYNRTL